MEQSRLKREAVFSMFGNVAGTKLLNWLDPCCPQLCEYVKACLGISTSGDPNTFLNGQGQFIAVSGGGGSLPLSRIAFGSTTNTITSNPGVIVTIKPSSGTPLLSVLNVAGTALNEGQIQTREFTVRALDGKVTNIIMGDGAATVQTISLPLNSGANGSVLGTDGGGQTNWITDILRQFGGGCAGSVGLDSDGAHAVVSNPTTNETAGMFGNVLVGEVNADFGYNGGTANAGITDFLASKQGAFIETNTMFKIGTPGQAATFITVNPNISQTSIKSGQSVQISSLASSATISAADYVIAVNTGAVVNVTLPLNPSDGDTYVIKDATGNALTNPITIVGNGHNINGAAFTVINTIYGVATVVYSSGFSRWLTI